MDNVHERLVHAPADRVGRLLERLGRDGDSVWPAPAWLPMRLDRSVQVGADGGHGPIRYRVSAYEPGRRVRFAFHPETGLDGFHELSVEPDGPGCCVVRHVLRARPRGAMRLLVPVVVRSLHDAVVEDLLDNVELAATGRIAEPARWSAWVRFWRRHTEFPRPAEVPPPGAASLARAAFDRVDFSDAWQVDRLPGLPDDPQVWADAVFRDPPRWVVVLLVARNLLVRLTGIEPADSSVFDTVARRDGEVLLGADSGHLDFRVSVLLEAATVTLTTVVRTHNRRGAGYMAVVSRVHGPVVRSMLHRARHRLADRAWRDSRQGAKATVIPG